jgi:hypothetical protein
VRYRSGKPQSLFAKTVGLQALRSQSQNQGEDGKDGDGKAGKENVFGDLEVKVEGKEGR